MNKVVTLFAVLALCASAEASWYWPFGESKGNAKVRVSELMEPVSELIDKASDEADAGKVSEAVETYRLALAELDRIEAENADRAQSAAFATLRNKRAYVNGAISSLLLRQGAQNARSVAVTDTTELEKKYAEMMGGKQSSDSEQEKSAAGVLPAGTLVVMQDGRQVRSVELDAVDEALGAKLEAAMKESPENRRVRTLLVAEDIRAGRLDSALATIGKLLEERPDDLSALNLRAAVETEKGEYAKAEATLDQAIQSNPNSYFAYYNMARLMLKAHGAVGKAIARDYYDTGRKCGGPEDKALEGQL